MFFKLSFVSYAVPRSGLWGPVWWACCSYCSSSGLSGGKVFWNPVIVNSQQWYHENGCTGRIQEQAKRFNCSSFQHFKFGDWASGSNSEVEWTEMVRCHSRLGGVAFVWVGSTPVLLSLLGSIVAYQHPKQRYTAKIQWYLLWDSQIFMLVFGIFWVPELSTKHYYTILNYQLGCHCDFGHPGSVVSFMELLCSKENAFLQWLISALMIVNGFVRGECCCPVLKTRYICLKLDTSF